MTLKLFTASVAITIAATMAAAVPGGFRLQTAVADGDKMYDAKNVNIQVGIRTAADGADVYTETHTTTTDSYGVADITVGEGKVVKGSFDALAWTSTRYYVAVSVDKGAGYVDAGVSEISAVPYALVAGKASSLVMTSASGKKFLVTIDDNGALTATPIAD